LVLFVLLLVAGTSMRSARAQVEGIEADIHPSSGTANTSILIRFLTTNASMGNVEKADIFWDDVSMELNQSGNQSADGSYNYLLSVPTEPPLSDIGNHTITVDSNVLNYGQASFNFTFEITEYVPSPEYLALNATYYSLLANYSDLLSGYNSLLVNYSTLTTEYETLLTNHTSLMSDYNSLSANYGSLVANFNALSANYNSLLISYNNLYNVSLTNYNNLYSLYSLFLANYTSLQGNYDSLSSNYNLLKTDYDSLESNYSGLVGELSITRNIGYVSVASTIILAVIIVYLVMIKPKLAAKAR
jgi:hypothetical protein